MQNTEYADFNWEGKNSFSIDGQPITDQQSKVFSNQIPLDAIASMEVISGAPPAEFGEKTSVVINAMTDSGLRLTTPTGSVTASYGSFGTSTAGFNLGYGGQKWGNFISASGLNTGRFLDPQSSRNSAKGNEENIFDRVDYQLSKADSIQFNLDFTRSWFQNPNSFDNVFHFGQTDPLGNPLGATDQRLQIRTFNIAPSWTRLLSTNAVFTIGGFVRHDRYNYYPSPNLFDDLSPIQQETVAQDGTLTNAGLRTLRSSLTRAQSTPRAVAEHTLPCPRCRICYERTQNSRTLRYEVLKLSFSQQDLLERAFRLRGRLRACFEALGLPAYSSYEAPSTQEPSM